MYVCDNSRMCHQFDHQFSPVINGAMAFSKEQHYEDNAYYNGATIHVLAGEVATLVSVHRWIVQLLLIPWFVIFRDNAFSTQLTQIQNIEIHVTVCCLYPVLLWRSTQLYMVKGVAKNRLILINNYLLTWLSFFCADQKPNRFEPYVFLVAGQHLPILLDPQKVLNMLKGAPVSLNSVPNTYAYSVWHTCLTNVQSNLPQVIFHENTSHCIEQINIVSDMIEQCTSSADCSKPVTG